MISINSNRGSQVGPEFQPWERGIRDSCIPRVGLSPGQDLVILHQGQHFQLQGWVEKGIIRHFVDENIKVKNPKVIQFMSVGAWI